MADLYPARSLEDLLAEGWCECGVPLASHPPLEPRPLRSWKSERETPPEFRSGSSLVDVRRMTDHQLAARREMGGTITPRQRPWSVPR